ncbi:hypothetical protein GCM10011504_07160 [Siccirubricoccus deserti]|uniref:DUF2076 domain-containing protein n=1 Tax=Siccirubricoccus deserti TaxID=2013562 RepID=A0A9X0UCN7_9PROT|nr:DUF2076 family protein [Siccirubricoccus deserti]MBC4014608.1 DUF2076 domain-containing protein [Siccirubricoccus deserti]GGC31500.1 hypothetical protein GCM10011504_07160 [Siccirubricoccus deserti]
MNDEERRIITQFVERIAGAAPAAARPSAGPWGGSSVPQTRPPLPPVDREADALITDLFSRYPEARYRITQTAFVQEAALVEAQNRIRQLEWEVENAQRQAQTAQQPQRGGLFGGMFGGGGAPRQAAPMPPPPQPVYPPGYNPGMLQPQRAGSGFLGTALTTAAGVAGGMVLGNMLMGALSGHGGAAQAATAAADGGGAFGQEAVPTSSPWTDPGAAAASQGWGDTQGSQGYDGQDASAGGYDSDSGYDTGGSMDDAGGGYDEEI